MRAEKTPAAKKRGADETLVNARLRELFPVAATKAEAKQRGEREVAGSFKMLTHDRITVRLQVRRTFPKADMDELRASIREIRAQNGGIEGSGVLQALLVSPLHDESGALIGYRLIAGEKRFRATQAEDVPEVPCIVIPEASEPVVRLMQLTENAQRTPPPVLDEALAIRDTMKELDLSLRDMARMMGKSKGYIEMRANLPQMGEDIHEMVSARADTLRHARLIHPIEDEDLRRELITAVIEEEVGEREIQRRIEAAANPSGITISRELSARADSRGESSKSGSNGQGTSEYSNDGDASAASSDPLLSALRPAVAFAAEFGRLVQKLQMTREYRQAVEKELEILEREVARIRKKLG